MEQYLINDTTLTAIGDALRNKFGDTKIIIHEREESMIISKTPNALSFTERNGGYGDTKTLYNVVYIHGASKIKVKMSYQTENTKYDWVQVASGNYPNSSSGFPTSTATKYGNKTLSQIELEFDNTDIITFYFRSDGSNSDYLGYYAECIGYDVDGNIINFIVEEEEEVPNTYLPTEMSAAIDNIVEIPPEALVITGDCEYRFANDGWNWFIEKYGDKITTKQINSMNYMFNGSTIKKISFDINADRNSNCSLQYMFSYCTELARLPKILNVKPSQLNNIFAECRKLRTIPSDYFDTWNWSYINTCASYQGNMSAIFNGCYSLRSFPLDFLREASPNAGTSYTYFYNGFNYCCVLDELVNLPIPYTVAIQTSNIFYGTFSNCFRLKNITFEMNEDGTPIEVKWKSQTIDLASGNVGYLASTSYQHYITSYNSGITSDKIVIDDASYQALKNDPDWYTAYVDGGAPYCRYNHDSAVATINSLPDTSAYLASAGGTNTIKFKGYCGSKTDGGAINTLTAEEIAVAAAKGWTVTLS